MYLSIGDTGYGAQPVKATCSVNTNQTVLDCELASSENRSLGQIANVSIDNGFLSARSGIIRERWAFETASDNWYTYPWQDNWDFRHDAKAVIASFRAAAKQATDVDIIAETWRTGPLFKGIPDDFARRNGVWYQSTFFAPPKTAMYRFPIKYQAHTNAEKPKTYVDGEFYSGVNVYQDAARGAFAWKPMVEGSVYHLEIHGLKHGKGNGELEVGMDMTFNLEDAPQLNPGSQNTLSQLVTTGMGLDGGLTTWRVLLPDDVAVGGIKADQHIAHAQTGQVRDRDAAVLGPGEAGRLDIDNTLGLVLDDVVQVLFIGAVLGNTQMTQAATADVAERGTGDGASVPAAFPRRVGHHDDDVRSRP